MIEAKFDQFFRSPVGIGVTILVLCAVAVLVLYVTMRIFGDLLNPVPYIFPE